jgi:hypothetical protein
MTAREVSGEDGDEDRNAAGRAPGLLPSNFAPVLRFRSVEKLHGDC